MAKQGSYGIKEVADVKFYVLPNGHTIKSITPGAEEPIITLDDNTRLSIPRFTFDSLKVSNIEFASEDTYAQGGKGNPRLIGWSYGKTATFTMTDALISMDTLALWLGGKEGENGGSVNNEVTITAGTFPDTYVIAGVTSMRSYDNGEDAPFFFVIPKGHVQVNGTVTMEAEGDPSTFEMTIDALALNVGAEKDVLVKFLTPAGASDLPIYNRSLVSTDTTTGVSIEIANSTTVGTTVGHVSASIDSSIVTIKATADAAPGETALVYVQDSQGDIAKININFVAE